MNPRILNILSELYDDCRIERRLETIAYREREGINLHAVAPHCGPLAVCPITLLSNRRFDLPDHGADAVEGCIIEALGADGESVIDLCAWPISDPSDVCSLCGVAPMVGLSNTLNSSTYFLGHPLVVHRNPLDWLRADCHGAAVVVPQLAARVLLEIADIGGRVGAEDFDHARELRRHLDAMTRRVEIVAPKPNRIVA